MKKIIDLSNETNRSPIGAFVGFKRKYEKKRKDVLESLIYQSDLSRLRQSRGTGPRAGIQGGPQTAQIPQQVPAQEKIQKPPSPTGDRKIEDAVSIRGNTMQEQCTDGPSSARGQPAPKKFPDGPPAESYQKKRFSVPAKLAPIAKASGERRVTLVRPCESFREAKEKHSIHFGYAALNTEFNDSDPTCSNDSGCSVFTIFTGEEQRHTVCQQPVGPQADLFISTLSDKSKSQLKKFLDNTPRQDNEYFVWVRETSSQVVTVLSIKTLENHLKSKSGIRRVKWRHLSAERLSIYRYSLPSIGGKGARVRECVLGHRKLCLLFIWLLFVLLICITVVIGSTNGNDLALNGTNYAHQHHNI